MKIQLADSTFIRLQQFVQTNNYRRPIVDTSKSEVEVLCEIASNFVPHYWPNKKLYFVMPSGFENSSLAMSGDLPSVLCIGDFVSNRNYQGELRPTFANLVWIQDEFSPHISSENMQSIINIQWEAICTVS